VIALPPLLAGAVNATLAEAFPAVATAPDGAPGTVVVIHGTPGQFSNAAFFHRTLISSRLNEALRFISVGEISLDKKSPLGFPHLNLFVPNKSWGVTRMLKF
jgi:hypothetical protein